MAVRVSAKRTTRTNRWRNSRCEDERGDSTLRIARFSERCRKAPRTFTSDDRSRFLALLPSLSLSLSLSHPLRTLMHRSVADASRALELANYQDDSANQIMERP